jgi:hypothetical protein
LFQIFRQSTLKLLCYATYCSGVVYTVFALQVRTRDLRMRYVGKTETCMSLGATYSTASMGTEASMRRSRVRTYKSLSSLHISISLSRAPSHHLKSRPSCLNIAWVIEYTDTLPPSELWSQNRFLELIMGEIPRLRDDKAHEQ